MSRMDRMCCPVSCCARERRTSHLFRIVPEYFGSKFLIARTRLRRGRNLEDLCDRVAQAGTLARSGRGTSPAAVAVRRWRGRCVMLSLLEAQAYANPNLDRQVFPEREPGQSSLRAGEDAGSDRNVDAHAELRRDAMRSADESSKHRCSSPSAKSTRYSSSSGSCGRAGSRTTGSPAATQERSAEFQYSSPRSTCGEKRVCSDNRQYSAATTACSTWVCRWARSTTISCPRRSS